MAIALLWPGPQRMDPVTPELLRGAIARADGFLWLDLCPPEEADRQLLQEALGFHPLALEDAFRARERPKLDVYSDHYFMVFYTVDYDPDNGLRLQPVHLFMGPRYLVTVRPQRTPEVEAAMARWGGPEFPRPIAPGGLVYDLLDAILDRYFPILDRIAEEVEAIEERLFAGSDGRLIEAVFRMRKALLELRRAVAPEREVINLLLRRELPIFQPEDMAYFQDLYDRLVRLTESIDLYRDMLSGALESYLSIQSNRLNEIVKVLTIASIILMADALIAGIYGMNFRYMPELEWPWGYPMALLMMVGVSAGLALFFRRRGWL
ncbi:Cobalt/magnesium transport protein CorA [Candidatus Thermoflexus japonica]|uniref:Magnesium transport protein CorA n=1 Tax=Candidatus Thermoflexus japonica TaxID=2035417 RepID=A0A2H5Y4J1_9CHLR|nr:Cobalt/magnesium transport protein CorA [Candidatus Thermoflexus japonica]